MDITGTNYYDNGSYENKVITLGKTSSVEAATMIVDYYYGSTCEGVKPYKDITVDSSTVPRLGSIAVHQI